MNRSAAMLLCIMLAAAPGFAHQDDQARPSVSLDRAVEIARGEVDGKVIGASTRERRGRIVYQVKILTPDGTVRTIRVDGETGRVLR